MFQIHPQLIKDCHLLGEFNSCHVLLHKNALLHWFILVPKTDCKNILELNTTQLNEVMQSAQSINRYLIESLRYTKTNFASIGNMVNQLHVHVVGRKIDDACWPKPVWGNLPDGPEYDTQSLDEIRNELNIKV